MSQTNRREPEPTDEDVARIKGVMFDTLLGSQPLVYSNVRIELAKLLRHLKREKLAKIVADL